VWSYRLLLGRFTRSTLDTSDLRHKLKVLRYLVSAAIQSLLKAASNDTDLPGIGNQPCQRLPNLVYGRNCRRLEKTVETREETCRIKSRADSTTNASQDISKHSLLLFLTVEGDDRVIFIETSSESPYRYSNLCACKLPIGSSFVTGPSQSIG
jgi:hypothetical protein